MFDVCQFSEFLYIFPITGDRRRWITSIKNMSEGHINEVGNTTFERTDPRWCFAHTRPLVLFISSPPSDPSLSLCFRKALKGTQICRLSESKNRSQNKAVAPQSEWLSEWATETGSLIHKNRTFEWGGKKNLTDSSSHKHTPTHTWTHHTDHGALTGPLRCGWKTALSEPWVSELDKREYESRHIWIRWSCND